MPTPPTPTIVSPANGATVDASVVLEWTIPNEPPPPTNTAPTVAMSAPAAGASVPAGQAVVLRAVTSDADGTVTAVTFKVNGGAALAGVLVSANTWEYAYTPLAAGAYSVVPTATDDDGATTVGAARAFTATAAPAGNTYVYDFAGQPVAAGLPAGLEGLFNYAAAINTIAIVAEPSALSGRCLRVTLKSSAGGRLGLGFLAAGSFTDGEILLRSRTIDSSITGPASGAFLRGAGATMASQAGYNGYAMGYASDRVARILPYVAGTVGATLASAPYAWLSAVWYYTLLRIQGDVLKLKVWAHGEEEPAQWTLGEDGLLTDTQLAGPGKAGIQIHSSLDQHDIDWLAVAVGAGSAPRPGA